MDGLVRRKFGLDGVEEADEFLMAVALHVAADHRAIEDIERGEQRSRAVAIFEENFQAMVAAMTQESLRFKSENYEFPYPNLKYKHGFGGVETPNNVDHGLNTIDDKGMLFGLGIVPQPVQKPLPPLRVVTESVSGFTGAARRDMGAITWYPTRKGLRSLFETYQAEMARIHNQHLALGERCAVLRLAFVAKTDEEARRITEGGVDGFSKFCAHVRRSNVWLDIDEDQNDPRFADMAMYDLLMERDHLIIGSPETVFERMKRMSEEQNVSHWLLQMGFPGIRSPDLESSLKLFSEEVMPALRAL